jgi:hypothetical protein
MEKFQLEHTSGLWLLFIVSSKASLKTVLLYFGNKVNSVPLIKEVNMTETHEYLQGLLQKYTMKNTGWIHVLT